MSTGWVVTGRDLEAVERRWSQPRLDTSSPAPSGSDCAGWRRGQAARRIQVWFSVVRPRLSSRRRFRAAARVWIHQLFATTPR